MSEEKSWGHFYEGSGDIDYYNRHVEIHRPFLERVLSFKPKRILEAGCGSGIMSIFFSEQGIESVAVDRDETILRHAVETNIKLGGKAVFRRADIFGLDFKDDEFDAVFSQGVLEHFEDDRIRAAMKEALRVAPRVWVSVPSKYYNHKDFGDERLLSSGEWREILEPVGEVKTDYYYFIRVKRNFLLKRPLMLMIEVGRRGVR